MPIKKSSLEKNLFYRLVKVFTILFPLMVVAVAYSRGYIKNSNLTENNIIYAVIAIVLYVMIINVVWGIFLYIVFGGMENDMIRATSAATQPVGPAANQAAAQNGNPAAAAGPLIFLVIIIIFIAVLSQQSETNLYGTSCTSKGKTGLYGTSGNCITCSDGDAVINPINNCSDDLAGVYCCNAGVRNNKYGTACTYNGKTGLYGTNGSCLTCSAGQNAVTDPRDSSCSNGIAGVYCCISGGNGGSKCIPTGCNKEWRCVGSYYAGNRQISVNGCFPASISGNTYSGWSGTCRQCP